MNSTSDFPPLIRVEDGPHLVGDGHNGPADACLQRLIDNISNDQGAICAFGSFAGTRDEEPDMGDG